MVKFLVRYPGGEVWSYMVPFKSQYLYRQWWNANKYKPGQMTSYIKQNAESSEHLTTEQLYGEI